MGVTGSKIDVPQSIFNGLMLHVIQGDEFDRYYRLHELTSACISRRHSTIELNDEKDICYVKDVKRDKETKEEWSCSLNGTYVILKV